ncbi:E3 ubiquitin-protein ligase RNF165 [Nymphon striatum]|nr:E3 ubiquitin-protein ligase RNF165 [Nymphon striatum]
MADTCINNRPGESSSPKPESWSEPSSSNKSDHWQTSSVHAAAVIKQHTNASATENLLLDSTTPSLSSILDTAFTSSVGVEDSLTTDLPAHVDLMECNSPLFAPDDNDVDVVSIEGLAASSSHNSLGPSASGPWVDSSETVPSNLYASPNPVIPNHCVYTNEHLNDSPSEYWCPQSNIYDSKQRKRVLSDSENEERFVNRPRKQNINCGTCHSGCMSCPTSNRVIGMTSQSDTDSDVDIVALNNRSGPSGAIVNNVQSRHHGNNNNNISSNTSGARITHKHKVNEDVQPAGPSQEIATEWPVAPDLQLDCLTSDDEDDDSGIEVVTIGPQTRSLVKNQNNGPKRNQINGNKANSTVLVDLTESDEEVSSTTSYPNRTRSNFIMNAASSTSTAQIRNDRNPYCHVVNSDPRRYNTSSVHLYQPCQFINSQHGDSSSCSHVSNSCTPGNQVYPGNNMNIPGHHHHHHHHHHVPNPSVSSQPNHSLTPQQQQQQTIFPHLYHASSTSHHPPPPPHPPQMYPSNSTTPIVPHLPRMNPAHQRLLQVQHRMQEVNRRRYEHHIHRQRDQYAMAAVAAQQHPHNPWIDAQSNHLTMASAVVRPEIPVHTLNQCATPIGGSHSCTPGVNNSQAVVSGPAAATPILPDLASGAEIPSVPLPPTPDLLIHNPGEGNHLHHHLHHYHHHPVAPPPPPVMSPSGVTSHPPRLHHFTTMLPRLQISIAPPHLQTMNQRPDIFPIPQLPEVSPTMFLYPQYMPLLTRHMQVRLDDYMRIIEQRRSISINRGATQPTIERNTFPHKYKKNVKCSEGDDNLEKCTICLCEFENDEDVR